MLDFVKNFVYLDIGEKVPLRVKYDEYKLITVQHYHFTTFTFSTKHIVIMSIS